jgi:hypothetical protein
MLISNGPMTLEQFAHTTQMNGADIRLFERFLTEHSSEFTRHPDNTYWFTGHRRPVQRDFESISHALAYALSLTPEGASVEELTWFLCLSTVNTFKTITRRNVSRELSRRADLFQHLARARYRLIENRPIEELPAKQLPLPPTLFAPPPPPVQRPVSQLQLPPQQVYPPFNLPAPDPPIQKGPTTGNGEEDFDPFSFFGNEFQFAFE